DPVEAAAEAPLTDAQAVALLELLRSIDALEEADLDAPAADVDSLPSPEAFAALVADEREAAEQRDEHPDPPDPALLAAAPVAASMAELRRRRAALGRRSEGWVAGAASQVTAGMAGRWRELERMTRETLDVVRPYVPDASASQVTGVEGHDLAAVQADATALS